MTAVCAATKGLMPLGGNLISDFGLGAQAGLSGEWPGHAPLMVALGVTAFSILGAILALYALGRVVWRIINPSREFRNRCVAVFGNSLDCDFSLQFRSFCSYLPTFIRSLLSPNRAHGDSFDLAGFNTAGLAAAHRPTVLVRPIGIAAGLLSLLLLLAYSVAGTHDYLDWNRERWSALCHLASELTIRPTEIDGGWEYNNFLVNDELLYKNYHERNLMMSQRELDDESVVGFSTKHTESR
jgi:hypothetical protein